MVDNVDGDWTGIGALAQVTARIAIPFLRKYIVPAAKRVDAELLEFAEVFSSRKNFKIAAKSVGRQTLTKQTGSGIREWTASRTNPDETFLQTFLINHVEQFSVLTFCGSFEKSWRESSSS